jgi:hypothetical protein
MRFCTTCGRQQQGTTSFCTGCGAPLRAAPPAPAAPGPRSPRRPRRMTALIAAAGVLVLAAGGTAAWAVTRHRPPVPLAARPRSPRSSGRPAAASPPAASLAPASAPASSGPPPLVQVSPAAAASPVAGPVENLVTSYFTAINQHDYQQYASLLAPAEQPGTTPASFASGFGSTTDSDVSLTSIATADDGSAVAASVTFTSQQAPSSSPDDSPCDTWQITLYLQPDGPGYLIGPAPGGYAAAHSPCA